MSEPGAVFLDVTDKSSAMKRAPAARNASDSVSTALTKRSSLQAAGK